MAPEIGPAERSDLAARILRTNLRVRRGENVVIDSWGETLGWADAFIGEARNLGAHPVTLYESETAFWDASRRTAPSTVGVVARHELALLENTAAWVYLPPPAVLGGLHKRFPAAQRILDQWDNQWYRAARESGLRAIRLELTTATEENARQLGVNLEEWRRELVTATRELPTAIRARARTLLRRLGRGRRVTIRQPGGTRLDLGLAGRAPVVQDGTVSGEDALSGRIMAVLPGGALAVAVDERFAEGEFVSNRPSRHYRGTFEDVRWTFHGGRLVDHETGRGSDVFEDHYRKAPKGRDRPALLTVGLNPHLRDAPFFEDLQLGVVTLYLGRNNDFGGRSTVGYREFALAEGVDLEVDGRPLVRAGSLV